MVMSFNIALVGGRGQGKTDPKFRNRGRVEFRNRGKVMLEMTDQKLCTR